MKTFKKQMSIDYKFVAKTVMLGIKKRIIF